MTIEEILSEVVRICRQHHASQVVLFGSRSKGTARKESDIDIAVSGVKDIDALQEEIADIPTLYTVDVLSLDECSNELLLEDIRQYGREIYHRNIY